MNRRILVLCAVMVALVSGPAQEKQASDPCKGNTQSELNACAAGELDRADAELNRVYHQLLKTVEGDKLATTKIKWAEQTWIVYRDAYLEAMYPAEDKQANYGSIYPMEHAELMAKLTRQQTSALKELLRAHSPDRASPGE
jgi:uncharacterized protein YecT (DUF1311 family)